MKNAGEIVYRKLKSGGYELLEAWWVETGIAGCAARILYKNTPLLELDQAGKLSIYPGYRWDGASGPVVDRKTNMRAGLAHDGLYQLHRAGKLAWDYREESDAVYRELVIACGGYRWVASLDYYGLRWFGAHAAKPQKEVEEKKYAA